MDDQPTRIGRAEDSLERISNYLSRAELHRLAQTYAPESRASFIETLHAHLDEIRNDLAGSADLYNDAGEVELTKIIAFRLNDRGYTADADVHERGHADLRVQTRCRQFSWIGEAKIYDKIADCVECLAQLVTRRESGQSRDAGGVLLYLHQKNASLALGRWKQSVEEQSYNGLRDVSPDPSQNPLSFYSTHDLEGSGTAFRVRHMAVTLYFKPEDKSGKASKGSKEAAKKKAPKAKRPAKGGIPKKTRD